MSEKVAVLVTTKHRGVFFGYTAEDPTASKSITLTNCRNCIFWSRSVGGFLGLAGIGPDTECKIGTLAPLPVLLHDITSVSAVTPDAERRWIDA
jgi:hypothetical protein